MSSLAPSITSCSCPYACQAADQIALRLLVSMPDFLFSETRCKCSLEPSRRTFGESQAEVDGIGQSCTSKADRSLQASFAAITNLAIHFRVRRLG